MKKVVVTGSSGFVADYVMKELSRRMPHMQILGISRSGKARYPETMHSYTNITYMSANCLKPETYAHVMDDADGLIHCVGSIVEDRNNPQLTFQALNRDSAINMARELNSCATGDAKRNFVFVSSSEAPPLKPNYLKTKREAEEFITSNCPNLNVNILRPGYIWCSKFRQYGYDEQSLLTAPLRYLHEILFGEVQSTFGAAVNLETVGHFACEGIIGNLKQDIIEPKHMIEYEKSQKDNK